MRHTLRDLNWSLLIINMLGAAALGFLVSYQGNFSLSGYALTVGSIAAKDVISFVQDAKKKLSEE